MKPVMLLICLAFGSVMILAPAFAQDVSVQGVYCEFDLHKWERGDSLLGFLKKGSDCDVEVSTDWGEFKYSQPLVVDPREIDLNGAWDSLWKD